MDFGIYGLGFLFFEKEIKLEIYKVILSGFIVGFSVFYIRILLEFVKYFWFFRIRIF